MSNDLQMSLLTVLGVLTGIGVLLYVMAMIDPTTQRRPKPSHRGSRR